MPISREDIVRLAYQLILGRDVESDAAVTAHAGYEDVYALRSAFMGSFEYKRRLLFENFISILYSNEEYQREKDNELNVFLRANEAVTGTIYEQVTLESSEYGRFHTTRFAEQLQAVAAIYHKLLPQRAALRILDIGVAPVAGMYRAVVPLGSLYTASVNAMPAEILSQYGIFEHLVIDLETETLPSKWPELVSTPLDIIIFSEVLEHIRVSPHEVISDLLQMLTPDGVLIVSTPNAFSLAHARALFGGKKGDAIYTRTGRNAAAARHIHVREYTAQEIRDAVAQAGGVVLCEGIRAYYTPASDPIRRQYVSSRDGLLFLIRKTDTQS
jgi:SAM-dependent methyltransferase